jgi:hypothetical protein
MTPSPACLPFVDTHDTLVDASPAATWDALVVVVRASFDRPGSALIARLLGCEPSRRGDSSPSVPGATLPGFRVTAAEPGRQLALEGRHRFSRYRLVFVLDPVDDARCRLRAETWAAFPGLAGRAYRALVVGTHGHVLVVCLILALVCRRAPVSA